MKALWGKSAGKRVAHHFADVWPKRTKFIIISFSQWWTSRWSRWGWCRSCCRQHRASIVDKNSPSHTMHNKAEWLGTENINKKNKNYVNFSFWKYEWLASHTQMLYLYGEVKSLRIVEEWATISKSRPLLAHQMFLYGNFAFCQNKNLTSREKRFQRVCGKSHTGKLLCLLRSGDVRKKLLQIHIAIYPKYKSSIQTARTLEIKVLLGVGTTRPDWTDKGASVRGRVASLSSSDPCKKRNER